MISSENYGCWCVGGVTEQCNYSILVSSCLPGHWGGHWSPWGDVLIRITGCHWHRGQCRDSHGARVSRKCNVWHQYCPGLSHHPLGRWIVPDINKLRPKCWGFYKNSDDEFHLVTSEAHCQPGKIHRANFSCGFFSCVFLDWSATLQIIIIIITGKLCGVGYFV